MTLSPRSLFSWIRMRLDIIKGLIKSRLWRDISSEINAPISVANDFLGINIATSNDPACDDYIIDSLRTLKINYIRMNFSYDSIDSYGERLLNRILDEGFDVLLNLLPPKKDAEILLTNKVAAINWQKFVKDIFHRYHNKVTSFEIGNASNRQKWSGYNPASYIEACRLARSHSKYYKIKLAGPNISDFEPIYNIAYLKALQRINAIPAIHTDNLFVERVVEPEAYDHRVLGRKSKNKLKLNLIKKARVIDSIGKELGCKETYATYQCWTIKRLSRWSKNPEQKQADYLSRYLILAAASDALDRVYWGPLLCSRDGIIDDGSAIDNYPEIDHVSYYQKVRGNVRQFRQRPAFFALKLIRTLLNNVICVQGLSADNGINHFIFTHENNSETHITWCRDGLKISSLSLYLRELDKQVLYYNNLGEKLDRIPLNITEQPVFIHFPKGVKVYRPEQQFVEDLSKLRPS